MLGAVQGAPEGRDWAIWASHASVSPSWPWPERPAAQLFSPSADSGAIGPTMAGGAVLRLPALPWPPALFRLLSASGIISPETLAAGTWVH